jgi:hypothetical protein
METSISNFLTTCSRLDFGPVNLSEEEKEFSRDLNREILLLCKSLPESVQTEAVLFLLRYLRVSLEEGANFVRYFYAPAWSIVYWLMKSIPGKRRLDLTDLEHAKTGHTMAMFLHAIDDHLTDQEVPVTHLTLLLRSQSWMIMSKAFEKLSGRVEKGTAIVRDFINDYYSSIGKSDGIESLDSYCDYFRKQMATALIVPILLARRIDAREGFATSIQEIYSSFGIAWRLLDDLQDLEKDMKRGVHSSPYVCLPEEVRKLWNGVKDESADEDGACTAKVCDCILTNKVADRIMRRICSELDSAATKADSHNITGLADELRRLLKPLMDSGNCL